jgi:hypothetical protein
MLKRLHCCLGLASCALLVQRQVLASVDQKIIILQYTTFTPSKTLVNTAIYYSHVCKNPILNTSVLQSCLQNTTANTAVKTAKTLQ